MYTLRFRAILAAWVVAFSISCAPNDSGKGNSQEESLIRSSREKSNQAIAQRDTATLASLWTNDFHVVSSRNAEMSGRIPNRDRFAADFANRPDILYVRTPEVIKVFEQWNMASEAGHWSGHWTDNGVRVELGGTYFAKWHKINGRWLIRAEIFVPLTCAGGKFCDQVPI